MRPAARSSLYYGCFLIAAVLIILNFYAVITPLVAIICWMPIFGFSLWIYGRAIGGRYSHLSPKHRRE